MSTRNRSRSSKRLEKELKELREPLRIVRQRLVEAGLVPGTNTLSVARS
jgi:hypothetical protein